MDNTADHMQFILWFLTKSAPFFFLPWDALCGVFIRTYLRSNSTRPFPSGNTGAYFSAPILVGVPAGVPLAWSMEGASHTCSEEFTQALAFAVSTNE